MQDTNTFNIMNGLAIFLKVCSNTKILAHSGAIDVILTNRQYTQDELDTLVQFGWEELSDYSWRYWLASQDLRLGERKVSPWISLAGKYENDEQLDEVLAHIADYRKELDEVDEGLWEKTYRDLTEEDTYHKGK